MFPYFIPEFLAKVFACYQQLYGKNPKWLLRVSTGTGKMREFFESGDFKILVESQGIVGEN